MATCGISKFIESPDSRQLSPLHLKGGGALTLPLDRCKSRPFLFCPVVLLGKRRSDEVLNHLVQSVLDSRAGRVRDAGPSSESPFDTKLKLAHVDKVVRSLSLVQVRIAKAPSLAANLTLPLSHR